MNVNNTGLLGGTNRRTLSGGGTSMLNTATRMREIKGARCEICPSRPLGAHVSGPVLRNRDLVTAVSHIPYAVRLARGIIGTCRTNTLPLGALTGTMLTGGSRVQRVMRHGCKRTRGRTIRHAENVRWGRLGAYGVGSGDLRRGGTTRHRIRLVADTLNSTTSYGNC